MSELTDLLKEVPLVVGGPYVLLEANRRPGDFAVTNLPERREKRRIGHQAIPANGQIIDVVDNDFYEQQSSEFKARFPELNVKVPTVLIEKARVSFYNPVESVVELTIERYLIRQR